MITLKNKDTNTVIGTLTPEQFQFLLDRLEEETPDDHDYWLNQAEIEILREQGADPVLIDLLETALGDADDMEVEWEKTSE